jgi:hypothetical protein
MFRDQGVMLVGVHTPEFRHEHDPDSVAAAIGRLGIPYPVTTDNDYTIWRSFRNRYWPALYVIHKRGVIRFHHAGELHVGDQAWVELVGLLDQLQVEPG